MNIEDDTTNPVDVATDFASFESEATQATETEVETPQDNDAEPELDGERNPIERQPEEEPETFEVKGADGKTYRVPASDWIEVQVNGQTVAIPKAAEAGVMKDADYTQRTQAIAAVERELASRQQASDAERQAEFVARSLAAQLQQFGNIDWAQAIEQAQWEYDQGGDDRRSAVAAAKARYDQTKEAFTAAAGQHQALRHQRENETQRETAKQIEEGKAAVAKLPGWTEHSARELTEFAIKDLGADPDEIGAIAHTPKIARVLMLARKGLAVERNEKKAAQLAKGAETEPARPLRGTGGSGVRPDTKDFAAFEKLAMKA